ncbi:hypothetical protein HPB47_022979 [Ixodes persulcatus]|uniref:Uncharacterized protein n=1 Tax=Ixodes persulcatus TaxID=34615 RepID=A0AC60QBE7_IXOPE|nr:hypothetical protein HPB47_022979 [Ixodes persulcatus]
MIFNEVTYNKASQVNGSLLVDAWVSMTRHAVNIYEDHPGLFTRRFHDPVEESERLVQGTPAHANFLDIVTMKQLVNDLRQLSPDTQTYELESFRRVLNGFVTKTFPSTLEALLPGRTTLGENFTKRWEVNYPHVFPQRRVHLCRLKSAEKISEHGRQGINRSEVSVLRDAPLSLRVTFAAIQPMTLDERAAVLEATMGQAENITWHKERVGRPTASNFKRILRCRKPDDVVRDTMYPVQCSTEAMQYGRYH